MAGVGLSPSSLMTAFFLRKYNKEIPYCGIIYIKKNRSTNKMYKHPIGGVASISKKRKKK
jgi:hypothetical protein